MTIKMIREQLIEAIAKALYEHRYGGDWSIFKQKHKDIADIYIENASVAIKAYEDAVK